MRLLFLAAGLTLAAQEVIPARAAATDYQAHARVAGGELAADFLGRTVPAPQAPFVTPAYVAVEVAMFVTEFEFNTGQFTLRLNGKQTVMAQTPGMVGASLQYPDWEGARGLEASGSAGNMGVILGRKTNTVRRFPGDRRVPTPPAGTPGKVETVTETAPWDWVAKLAWNDGPGRGPAGGLLYFPYKGSLAKLKTVELVYNGAGGKATLALRGSGGPRARSEAPADKP